MTYVAMFIVFAAPALLGFSALRQIAEAQPTPAPSPAKQAASLHD
jgi:hypothetical protein